jgi:peptide/nickel transport system permease protein
MVILMRRFVIRRLMAGILSLIAATAVVFALSRLAGDPLLLFAKPGGYGVSPQQEDALRASYGLDKPVVVQYLVWLGKALKGDLGETLVQRAPVRGIIAERIPASFQLGFAAWLLATLVGIPLGVLSAVRRATIWDYLGRSIALFGQALPVFWLGIMSILLFAVALGWLPAATRPVGEPLSTTIKYFILPTITLGCLPAAVYLRLTRSAMLEVMDSEFIKLARAKGISSRVVVWKHAFRNALIPPITVSALVLASFLEGSIIVETIFAWPGLGRMALKAVEDNDFPLLLGTVLFFAFLYVLFNSLADLLYARIDPRIRYT